MYGSGIDFFNNYKVIRLIDPATHTSDKTGDADVDMQGYEAVSIVVSVGQSGDTLSGSLYWELELQKSDGDSTYAACADDDITNAVSSRSATGTFGVIDTETTDEDKIFTTTYTGTARYVRLVLNGTAMSSGIPISAIAICHGAKERPADVNPAN